MTMGDPIVKGVLIDILHVLGIAKKNKKIVSKTFLNHVFEFNNNIVVVRNNQRQVVGEGMRDDRLYKLH
jgi:hypothetical protein